MTSDFLINSSSAISGAVDNAGILTGVPNTYDPNQFSTASPQTNGLNSASGGDASILSSVWDEGKSAFNALLPVVAGAYAAQAQANLAAAQSQLKLNQQLQASPPYTQQQKFTISIASIGAIVLLGAAFMMMKRRRK